MASRAPHHHLVFVSNMVVLLTSDLAGTGRLSVEGDLSGQDLAH